MIKAFPFVVLILVVTDVCHSEDNSINRDWAENTKSMLVRTLKRYNCMDYADRWNNYSLPTKRDRLQDEIYPISKKTMNEAYQLWRITENQEDRHDVEKYFNKCSREYSDSLLKEIDLLYADGANKKVALGFLVKAIYFREMFFCIENLYRSHQSRILEAAEKSYFKQYYRNEIALDVVREHCAVKGDPITSDQYLTRIAKKREKRSADSKPMQAHKQLDASHEYQTDRNEPNLADNHATRMTIRNKLKDKTYRCKNFGNSWKRSHVIEKRDVINHVFNRRRKFTNSIFKESNSQGIDDEQRAFMKILKKCSVRYTDAIQKELDAFYDDKQNDRVALLISIRKIYDRRFFQCLKDSESPVVAAFYAYDIYSTYNAILIEEIRRFCMEK